MESVALIDISSEDDLLIPSSSGGIGLESSSTLGAESMKKMSKQMEQVPEPSDPPKQKRRKADRFNLRKSLAWDKEFFTSEGVLNSEELSIVNGSYSKTIGNSLAGIPEELRKSTESTSTLDSESRALENLEARLFQNLPTLIHKSLDNSNRAANVEHSDNKKEQRMPDPHLRTLKKPDISSKAKVPMGNGETKTLSKPPKVLCKTVPLPAELRKNGLAKQIKRNTVKALDGTSAKQQPIRTLGRTNDGLVMASRLVPSKGTGSNTQPDLKLVSASCSLSSRNNPSCSSSLEIRRNAVRHTNHSSTRLSSNVPVKTATSKTKSKDGSCDYNSANSAFMHSSISPASSVKSFLSDSSSSTCTSSRLITSTEGSDSGLPSSPCQKSGAKSLGLRMPRPRIGYFDKEKNPASCSSKYLQTSLRNSLTMHTGVKDTAAVANRGKHNNLHPFTPKQTTKPAESHVASKNLNKRQELVPKLKMQSSPSNVRYNSSKKEQTNLLQSKLVHNQQEQIQNDLNVGVRNIQKENMCPALNGEVLGKALPAEDQHQATVERIGELVSALSLSEAKDVAPETNSSC